MALEVTFDYELTDFISFRDRAGLRAGATDQPRRARGAPAGDDGALLRPDSTRSCVRRPRMSTSPRGRSSATRRRSRTSAAPTSATAGSAGATSRSGSRTSERSTRATCGLRPLFAGILSPVRQWVRQSRNLGAGPPEASIRVTVLQVRARDRRRLPWPTLRAPRHAPSGSELRELARTGRPSFRVPLKTDMRRLILGVLLALAVALPAGCGAGEKQLEGRTAPATSDAGDVPSGVLFLRHVREQSITRIDLATATRRRSPFPSLLPAIRPSPSLRRVGGLSSTAGHTRMRSTSTSMVLRRISASRGTSCHRGARVGSGSPRSISKALKPSVT
jgi:hypothetical protein